MTCADDTSTASVRCSVLITRDCDRQYRFDCSCGLSRVYADRAGANEAAIRHGNDSGYGYSVTNR